MRFNKIIWIVVMLLLLATPLVSAELVVNKYSNDFALYAQDNEQVKMCHCETKRDIITIENVGNFYSEYDVSAESDTAGWIKITNTKFQLAPKDKMNIPIYIEAPCEMTGTYDYVIKVSSNYGRVRYLHRTIRTDQCQNSEMEVGFKKNNVNLCEPVKMSIYFKNTGTFAETYKLSFGTFDEYINTSQREFYLQPDESKNITATIKLPCSFYGDYDIPIILYSEKNRLENRQIKTLSVENQFDHSINIDTNREFCARIKQEYSFTIKNDIDVPNDFDLTLKGPGFMSLRQKTLHLEGLESKNITIYASPKKSDRGEYTAKIIARSRLGSIKKEKDIKIDVKNCYDFQTSIESYDNVGTSISEDKSCCGEKTYLLKIENKGETNEIYNIAVDGPSWITPEETSVSLHPSEYKLVKVFADLPCSDNSYDINFKVTLDSFRQVSEEKTLNITSLSQHTCRLVDIEEDELYVTKEDSVIPVLVTHKGVKGGAYSVKLDNDLYNIKEKSFTLYPGETRALHMIAKDTVKDAKFDRYILSPIFKPIDENVTGVEYEDFVGMNLKDISWLKKAYYFIVYKIDWGRPGWCGWLAIILLAILITTIIVLFILKINVLGVIGGGRTLNIVLKSIIGAVIIVLLALFIFSRWPSAHTYLDNGCSLCKSNSVVLNIHENDRLSVNLDDYFNDPDFDILSYTTTQPGHINARVDKNILTLTPEHNWVGEETMVFTAEDGKGGVADSPNIIVRVVEKEHLGFWDNVKRYCKKILLGEIILILGIILASVTLIKNKKI